MLIDTLFLEKAWKSFTNYDLAKKSNQAYPSLCEHIRVDTSRYESIRVNMSRYESIRVDSSWFNLIWVDPSLSESIRVCLLNFGEECEFS